MHFSSAELVLNGRGRHRDELDIRSSRFSTCCPQYRLIVQQSTFLRFVGPHFEILPQPSSVQFSSECTPHDIVRSNITEKREWPFFVPADDGDVSLSALVAAVVVVLQFSHLV